MLSGDWLSTPWAPLQLQLLMRNLDFVHLEMPSVHAKIPAAVAWRHLSVQADALCVSFEDVDAFMENVSAFRFSFKTCHGYAMDS